MRTAPQVVDRSRTAAPDVLGRVAIHDRTCQYDSNIVSVKTDLIVIMKAYPCVLEPRWWDGVTRMAKVGCWANTRFQRLSRNIVIRLSDCLHLAVHTCLSTTVHPWGNCDPNTFHLADVVYWLAPAGADKSGTAGQH